MTSFADVGTFVDLASAARRPYPRVELAAYGIANALRGAAVLDIGTGDGRLALGAAAAGARSVVGIDPDPAAVEAARGRARSLRGVDVSFRAGAAQALPVPNERFDIALLSWTL
jgi:predicted RNA methylase